MIRRTFRLATLLAPLFALGCGDAGRDAGAGRVATFDEAFATTGTIRLHESDSVLNVVSYVHPDSDDGYLVADTREHRVRKYRPDGPLAWQFGREGDGPGEVRGPRVVRRLPDRSLLVGEFVQRFTVFDSLGTAPLAVHRTPFTRVEDAVVVGPNAVMISAIGAPGLEGIEGPRLHLAGYGRRRGAVLRTRARRLADGHTAALAPRRPAAARRPRPRGARCARAAPRGATRRLLHLRRSVGRRAEPLADRAAPGPLSRDGRAAMILIA